MTSKVYKPMQDWDAQVGDVFETIEESRRTVYHDPNRGLSLKNDRGEWANSAEHTTVKYALVKRADQYKILYDWDPKPGDVFEWECGGEEEFTIKEDSNSGLILVDKNDKEVNTVKPVGYARYRLIRRAQKKEAVTMEYPINLSEKKTTNSFEFEKGKIYRCVYSRSTEFTEGMGYLCIVNRGHLGGVCLVNNNFVPQSVSSILSEFEPVE